MVFKASSLSPPILRYIHSFDRFLFGLGVDLSRHKLYAIKQICLGPQNGKNQSSLVAGHWLTTPAGSNPMKTNCEKDK